MSDATIENAIKENAAGPKRAQGDSGSVEQHSLADQIEADRYLASKYPQLVGDLQRLQLGVVAHDFSLTV